MKNKVAFVLIDGVGDVSIPRLGFKTPLETANTPVLDAIAGKHNFQNFDQKSNIPPPPLLLIATF
jgi:2,3-bisphosphoglycerate-independent phosphoglycerate mutase